MRQENFVSPQLSVPLSQWQFLWLLIKNSSQSGWAYAFVALFILEGLGCLAYAYPAFGAYKTALVVVPALLFVICVTFGLIWHAHSMYYDTVSKLSYIRNSLVPKIEVSREIDEGTSENQYRVKVNNVSMTTVECGASLIATEPLVENLPIPLHCSHEDWPSTSKIKLDPHTHRKFDVFRVRDGEMQVTGAVHVRNIPIQEYKFTIVFHGTNFEPIQKVYAVERKGGANFKLHEMSV